MVAHTPAWKSLGLQLKTIAARNVIEEAPPPTKKRKLSSDDQPPRLEDIVKGGPKKFAHLNVRSSVADKAVLNLRSTEYESAAKPKKERKSVSSDAGSKENRAEGIDDDSAENAARGEIEADGEKTSSIELVRDQNKKRKKKRTEKTEPAKELSPKSQLTDSQFSSRSLEKVSKKSSPPYLRYLEQYANDRVSWKFNKSHQIKLLDNLFNLNRVPTTNDAALIDYVKGLQGAGVRTRVKEAAERIVSEAPPAQEDAAANGLNSDSAAIDAPEDSSTISIDDSAPAAFKAKQVSRAHAVLAALVSSEPKSLPPSQTMKPADNNRQFKPQKPQQSKRSRGRVRRGLNDAPSSDESSILSESSSDEAAAD